MRNPEGVGLRFRSRLQEQTAGTRVATAALKSRAGGGLSNSTSSSTVSVSLLGGQLAATFPHLGSGLLFARSTGLKVA
jgi:hypothetical protein